MSDNNLFAEINPTEEATVSGGHYGCLPKYRPGNASATASATANASGGNAFATSFSDARVDGFGNASAVSFSAASAIG